MERPALQMGVPAAHQVVPQETEEGQAGIWGARLLLRLFHVLWSLTDATKVILGEWRVSSIVEQERCGPTLLQAAGSPCAVSKNFKLMASEVWQSVTALLGEAHQGPVSQEEGLRIGTAIKKVLLRIDKFLQEEDKLTKKDEQIAQEKAKETVERFREKEQRNDTLTANDIANVEQCFVDLRRAKWSPHVKKAFQAMLDATVLATVSHHKLSDAILKPKRLGADFEAALKDLFGQDEKVYERLKEKLGHSKSCLFSDTFGDQSRPVSQRRADDRDELERQMMPEEPPELREPLRPLPPAPEQAPTLVPQHHEPVRPTRRLWSEMVEDEDDEEQRTEETQEVTVVRSDSAGGRQARATPTPQPTGTFSRQHAVPPEGGGQRLKGHGHRHGGGAACLLDVPVPAISQGEIDGNSKYWQHGEASWPRLQEKKEPVRHRGYKEGGWKDDDEKVRASKMVAKWLRHDQGEGGVHLWNDETGLPWASTDSVQRALAREFQRPWVTMTDIEELVAFNSHKGRFTLSRNGKDICANHGHSNSSPAHAPAEPPAMLYHGTTAGAASYIDSQGLKRMGRSSVHLTEILPKAEEHAGKKSGRSDQPVIFAVEVQAALAAGYKFSPSRGGAGVWLSSDLPSNFVRRLTTSRP